MRHGLCRQALGQRAIAESLVLLALAGWWWSSTHLPAAVLPSPQAVADRLLDIVDHARA